MPMEQMTRMNCFFPPSSAVRLSRFTKIVSKFTKHAFCAYFVIVVCKNLHIFANLHRYNEWSE